MSNASKPLSSNGPLWNLQIIDKLKFIAKIFYCGLDIVAQLFIVLDIANIDDFRSLIRIDHIVFYNFFKHLDISFHKTTVGWMDEIIIVILADKHKQDVGNILILKLITVILSVIAISTEKSRHFNPRNANHVANNALARNCLQSIISIEHFGQIDGPTLATVLNVFHIEKTYWIPTTHHSISGCYAIAQKIKFIVISLAIFQQRSTFDLYTIENTVFARCDRSIMILSNFDNLYAMFLWIVGFKYGDFLIFFGMNSFCRVSIEHNMVNIPSVEYIPHNFFGLLKAKIDFETCPIVNDTSTLHIISAMQCDLIGKRSIRTNL